MRAIAAGDFGSCVVYTPPNVARVLFYAALIAAVFFTMRRSWPRLIAAFAATAAFGLIVHAVVDAVWSRGTAGHVTEGGFLTGVIRNWVLLPTNPGRLAVYVGGMQRVVAHVLGET